MQHCLDTSVCVEIMRQGESFDAIDLDLSDCVLSSIARFELEYGISRAPSHLKATLRERLALLLSSIEEIAFDGQAARHAADIRHRLETKGTPIGHYDTLIAAHARSRQLAVVTGNAREFKRVPKLKVIPV